MKQFSVVLCVMLDISIHNHCSTNVCFYIIVTILMENNDCEYILYLCNIQINLNQYRLKIIYFLKEES
jgi:hypothetical protein